MMAGGYLTGPGDQIITEPLLGSLQDNGGPTLTQWIQNINIVCIVLGGPVRAAMFVRTRGRGWRNRHPAAIRGVAPLDGSRLSHSSARDQTGGGRRQERL